MNGEDFRLFSSLLRDQPSTDFALALMLKDVNQAIALGLEHRAPIEARMDFDGVVESLEAIWAVFQQLIAGVIAQLARRGRGARRLDVELLRPSGPPVVKTIALSRPSRDPANLFNLFSTQGYLTLQRHYMAMLLRLYALAEFNRHGLSREMVVAEIAAGSAGAGLPRASRAP